MASTGDLSASTASRRLTYARWGDTAPTRPKELARSVRAVELNIARLTAAERRRLAAALTVAPADEAARGRAAARPRPRMPSRWAGADRRPRRLGDHCRSVERAAAFLTADEAARLHTALHRYQHDQEAG